MPLCVRFCNDVICVFVSAYGPCRISVQVPMELSDDIRNGRNIVMIFVNQGEYFTVPGNFLFRPIARFSFLADQSFQSFVTGAYSLNTVGSPCTLNHGNIHQRF